MEPVLRYVTTDTTGKVYFIGFNGKVKTVELPGRFTNRHFFDYKDLNGDGKLNLFISRTTNSLFIITTKSRLVHL